MCVYMVRLCDNLSVPAPLQRKRLPIFVLHVFADSQEVGIVNEIVNHRVRECGGFDLRCRLDYSREQEVS